jgi:DNA (cytosine-5)-methyltransferase 1
MHPRLLDLFCGAGGATRGYQMAGFYVVGVDIVPQPHYCGDEFIQADALTFPLDGFDVIHARPPCHAYSALEACVRHSVHYSPHPKQIDHVRNRLLGTSAPWIIENVATAPMAYYVTLCGGMFGLRTYRHRRFETSWLCFQPHHPRHTVRTSTHKRRRDWDAGFHISITGEVTVDVARQAMGIDWMQTNNELAQAIPPAYTGWIARQLLETEAKFCRE